MSDPDDTPALESIDDPVDEPVADPGDESGEGSGDESGDESVADPGDESGDESGDGIDFALAAFREEGVWQVQELVHDVLGDIEALAHALRRFPGDGGAVGLVGVDEDFFLILRVAGANTRILLSDVTAADEWELAASAVDALGLPDPEDDDDQVPAGDLDLLADLGMGAIDMGVLLDDLDLYPDEMLSDVARRLGFGELFDEAVGLASA